MLTRFVIVACLCAFGCDRVFGLAERDASSDPVDADRHIEYIQSKSRFQNGVSSVTLTFDAPVEPGDLVVVAIGTYAGDLQAVTDTAGNDYREPFPAIRTAGGSRLRVLYAPNVATASSFSITAHVAMSTSNETTMAIHAYRGATPEPLDQSSFRTGGPSTSPSSGPVKTIVDGELYFGVVSHDLTLVTSPGSGFSRRETPTEDTANVPISTEDLIGPAQPSIAAKFQLTLASPWACALLTFE